MRLALKGPTTMTRTLGHFPPSHPSTVFNLGKIKGKISSCNFQHKSFKSSTIPGLNFRSCHWAGKGHLWGLLAITAEMQRLRASGQVGKKAQNCQGPLHQLFPAAYCPSPTQV